MPSSSTFDSIETSFCVSKRSDIALFAVQVVLDPGSEVAAVKMVANTDTRQRDLEWKSGIYVF